MRTLNLGILAHVDAGKTTLSERLLYTAGAIDHVGSVDAGTTQTDSLELERERGITIRSAVASFLVGDLAVNLVDTPGHPDFIAEVERVLGVLDGAVLVVSAVEGVQPQTPLLFRALQRLRVPTLIFVNKIDRAGADPGPGARDDGPAARRRAWSRWARSAIPAGRRRPSCRSRPRRQPSDGAHRGPRRARRGDPRRVRGRRGGRLGPRGCARQLATQTRAGLVHPVFFGSAAMGIGIEALLDGDRRAAVERRAAIPRRPVSGRVFKIERTAVGRARRVRPPVRRARCGRASACVSAAARRRNRPRSGCSRRPVRRAATRLSRARWRRSGGWAPCGSATPIGRAAARRGR